MRTTSITEAAGAMGLGYAQAMAATAKLHMQVSVHGKNRVDGHKLAQHLGIPVTDLPGCGDFDFATPPSGPVISMWALEKLTKERRNLDLAFEDAHNFQQVLLEGRYRTDRAGKYYVRDLQNLKSWPYHREAELLQWLEEFRATKPPMEMVHRSNIIKAVAYEMRLARTGLAEANAAVLGTTAHESRKGVKEKYEEEKEWFAAQGRPLPNVNWAF